MGDKIVQLVPIQGESGQLFAFSGLDSTGLLWYGDWTVGDKVRIKAREWSNGAASTATPFSAFARMDPHERATRVWYRVAGLLRRKELAIEIVEAEVRSAQHEVLLEAATLVLTGEPIEIARRLRQRAEDTIRPRGRTP